MSDLKTEVFICDCYSSEHQFIFHYDEEEKMLYMDVHLTTYRNFFERVWAAMKYIFGHRSKYGDWDSVCLSKEKLEKLKNFLKETDDLEENL